MVPDPYIAALNANGLLCSRRCESLTEPSMSNGHPVKSLTKARKIFERSLKHPHRNSGIIAESAKDLTEPLEKPIKVGIGLEIEQENKDE